MQLSNEGLTTPGGCRSNRLESSRVIGQAAVIRFNSKAR